MSFEQEALHSHFTFLPACNISSWIWPYYWPWVHRLAPFGKGKIWRHQVLQYDLQPPDGGTTQGNPNGSARSQVSSGDYNCPPQTPRSQPEYSPALMCFEDVNVWLYNPRGLRQSTAQMWIASNTRKSTLNIGLGKILDRRDGKNVCAGDEKKAAASSFSMKEDLRQYLMWKKSIISLKSCSSEMTGCKLLLFRADVISVARSEKPRLSRDHSG